MTATDSYLRGVRPFKTEHELMNDVTNSTPIYSVGYEMFVYWEAGCGSIF